jgi:hypothetical protein
MRMLESIEYSRYDRWSKYPTLAMYNNEIDLPRSVHIRRIKQFDASIHLQFVFLYPSLPEHACLGAP